MCGIAGYFNEHRLNADHLRRMASVIGHRGPDAEGFFVKQATGTGLAHRRLSILDLSELGRQPMTYGDSSCWITYNGELYNYIELRTQLKQLGCSFATNTDTEVLLAAYCVWGVESFKKFNGMFAFAIYDERQESLLLCRDNYGIKPLYYWYHNESLVFGSELKAFAAVGGVLGLQWDERAIRTRLTSSYVLESTEFSFFKRVKRLLPGHYLKVDVNELELKQWWNTTENLVSVPRRFSAQLESFREIFLDACRIRMRSDVPLGASLSGGLDSSSIVCTLSRMGFAPTPFIHTFKSFPFDETRGAAAVAQAAGLKPVYVDIDQSADFEEADRFIYSIEGITSSLLPKSGYRVYQAQIRHGIKASLEGHGADEMLAGYHWHLPAARKDCTVFSPRFYRLIKQQSEMGGGRPDALKKIRQLLTRERSRPDRTPIDFFNPDNDGGDYPKRQIDTPDGWSCLQKALHESFHSFTLPSSLHSVDLMSMAHGVEVRLPFLDWRLVNFVFSLPDDSKINGGFSKYVLRESVRGLLPEPVRTKKGKIPFISPSPPPAFLQTEMRPWVESILHDGNPLENVISLDKMRGFYFEKLPLEDFTSAELRSFCSHLSAIRFVSAFNERFGWV